MPLPVENIVVMLNDMNVPKTIQYRNIPSVVVRLKGVSIIMPKLNFKVMDNELCEVVEE